MKLFVKDLKENDVLVNHNFAIKEIKKRTSKNGNDYYALVLADKTGFIEGKIWADNFSSCNANDLKEGDVISATGKIDSFRDKLQVILEKCKVIDDYDPSDFLDSSKKDVEENFKEIMDVVQSLDDTEVKNLILKIFEDEDLLKEYKRSPAGEFVHHSYVGGLLDHVYDMLMIGLKAKEVYPEVRFSELVFGILFHDIGKTKELGINGVVLSRTTPGYLIGHLGQGLILLNEYFPKDFDEDKKDRLLHLYMSHHGKRENGSPVQPMTLEAILLSEIDNLSFMMSTAISHIESEEGNIDEKGMTGYNKYIGSSLFPNLGENVEEDEDDNSEKPLFDD